MKIENGTFYWREEQKRKFKKRKTSPGKNKNKSIDFGLHESTFLKTIKILENISNIILLKMNERENYYQNMRREDKHWHRRREIEIRQNRGGRLVDNKGFENSPPSLSKLNDLLLLKLMF